MEQTPIPSAVSASQTFAVASPTDVHHVSLGDPTWAMWRWSVLRGTGFPVDAPLQLASPPCVAAADQLGQAEQAVQHAEEALIATLTGVMDNEPAQRVVFANIIHNVRKGKLPVIKDLPSHVQAAVTTLQAARTKAEAARTLYHQVFADTLIQATAHLQTLVAQPLFREALAWQNRQALHTGVAPFLAKPPTTASSAFRQHRLLLTKYLQRYCLKNDTIGFFGPVGWARWTPEQPETQVQPGPDLLAERTTYLEGWGINALSQSLEANPDLRPWAVPRLMPFMHVEGQVLYLPFVKPIPLTTAQAQVLRACNGKRTAQQVASLLLGQGVAGLSSATDVYAILEQLQKSRRITWGFGVSPEDSFPARTLRERLASIEPASLRLAAIAPLDQLEAAVAQVTLAGQDADAVDAAIGQVEATFTALTEQSSIRSAGKLYAGRTMIYEDTRRDVQVQLGGDLLRGLERPLAGMLTSSRWLAYHLTVACRTYYQRVYDELVAKMHSSIIEFTQFFPLVNADMFDESQANPSRTLSDPILAQFQQKWADVLGLPRAERHLSYTSDEIAARLHAAFAAPDSGWPLGHYHCPDVMLNARDAAAINRGDFQYVMGELHLGIKPFDSALFVQQHPQREDLYQAIALDMPAPRVVPAFSSQFLAATRIHQVLALPKDYRLVTVAEACDAPPERTLRMGDLVVEQADGQLLARTRDGKHQFEIMQLMGDYLSMVVGDSFSLLATSSHTPRITIDRLVVTREGWRMHANEVDFTAISDQADCFARVRVWAQSYGMPRFLFYRVAKEKKPCFLDLTSPLSVELFVKDVRRMVNSDDNEGFIVSLSEMMPDPEHAWLTDAEGKRYTCEIRLALFDRKH